MLAQLNDFDSKGLHFRYAGNGPAMTAYHGCRMSVRKIVHVDMDAFYASVEQRDNPELRGKPVVVAWRGKRSVVCAASYEARRFGVRSAMPLAKALALCPQAVVMAGRFDRYRRVAEQLRRIWGDFSPVVEPLSLDEAYLDVTENKMGLPTATRVARTIREQIREGITVDCLSGSGAKQISSKNRF